MDWEMKIWDLSELEPNMSGSDCSVDLKLGGSSDFRSSPASIRREEMRVPVAAESPSSSSKRARPPSGGIQTASCLVEGCNSDLSGCREYHRRHKVCEIHSKTPIVIVNGQEQRFCQQCSRFHMLAEFDEGKRSCRKRLDGHNRRRRKPQTHTIHSGNLFSNYPVTGSGFSLYSEIFPAARPESSCLRNHSSPSQLSGSYPRSYEEERRYPFAVSYPLTSTIAANSHSDISERMFHGGLAQVLDSELALSLLSSPSGSVGINLGHAAPIRRIPQSNPPFSFHQHGPTHYSYSQSSSQISSAGFSYPVLADEQTGGLLVTEATEADLHC